MTKLLELKKVKIHNSLEDGLKIEFDASIPNFLYKYYSVNKYSLSNLKESTFHFSHAHSLNDLMDGNLKMMWDMKSFIDKYRKDNKIPFSVKDFEIQKSIMHKLEVEFLKFKGVFSLSETYKNELLWVHYTNENGYCIEIDTIEFDTFLKRKYHDDYHFFPIDYEVLEQIDFNKYILKTIKEVNGKNKKDIDANIPIMYSFIRKDKFWSYEKEWRFVLRHKNFQQVYHPLEFVEESEHETSLNSKYYRNIKVSNHLIKKVILAPAFFNNERFSKLNFNHNSIKYHFNKSKSENETKEFLKLLYRDFNDIIYQVDKVVNKGVVGREICYQIVINEINNDYILLNKTDLYTKY